jgi:hypothetical protein
MSLLTAPVSAASRKQAAAPAQPVVPFVLQHAIDEIETKLKRESEQSKQTLVQLRQRLQGALNALDEDDPGHIRPIRDVRRKLETITRAIDQLNEADIMARLKIETANYIMRFKDLEASEKERKQKSDDMVKRSETRFLPMAPAQYSATGASGSKTTRNNGALMAQELKYKYGGDQRPVEIIQFDMCKNCKVAMQYNVALQQLVCPVPSCGYWKRFADMTSAALAYGEEIEFCKYSYNPVTHLDDTIRYAEAGEAYVVPPEHLEMVMVPLLATGTRPEDITIPLIRSIVYDIPEIKTENTVQIYSRLTGRSPRRLDSFATDQARIMFITQAPYYRKHCGGRTNMLSYPYILYKYCELLGYWEMLETMPLLRGPSNLSIHDAIQMKISRDLDWEFIPTVKDMM